MADFEISDYCKACIKKQLDKYKSFKSRGSDINYGETFVVKCKFIPKNYLDLIQSDTASLIEEEKEELISLYDPVKWAERNVLLADETGNFKPYDPKEREYQVGPLRCSALRSVSRWGRRCLTGDQPVLMWDGSSKRIKDMGLGDLVVSYDKKRNLVPGKVSGVYENGIQPVYKVTLTSGRSIKCTSNHPLLAFSFPRENKSQYRFKQWRTVEDGLSKEDKIYTIVKYDKFGVEDGGIYDNLDIAAFLGYFLSDGYINRERYQTPKITSCTKEYLKEIKEIVNRVWGLKCNIRERGGDSGASDVYLTDGDKGTPNPVSLFLKSIGISGPKSKRDISEKIIFSLSKRALAVFLNRLWAGDGCISTWTRKGTREKRGKAVDISLTSSNEALVFAVQQVLYKLNIDSRSVNQTRKSPRSENRGLYFSLHISSARSIKRFLDFTGNIFGKEAKCIEALEEIKKREYTMRNQRGNICERIKIKKIEYLGEEKTYDITVDEHHNFSVNGIINHNTGKCHSDISYLATDLGHMTAEQLYRLKNHTSTGVRIFAVNKKGEIYPTDRFRIFINGIKRVLKVTNSTGGEDYITENHPYFVKKDKYEWIEAKDLKPGDTVINTASLPKRHISYPQSDPSIGYLLGYMCSSNIEIKGSKINFINEENTNLSKHFSELFSEADKNLINDLLKKVRNKNGEYKSFPDDLTLYNDNTVFAFLAALFSCNGFINKDKKICGFIFDNKSFTLRLKWLLTFFGVRSSIIEQDSSFVLVISDLLSVRTILSRINFYVKDPNEQSTLSKNIEYLLDLLASVTVDRSNGRLYANKIESIEDCGERKTFGISLLEETKSYIASETIVHNTTTFCIKILWHAYTQSNKVLVIAPRKTHINDIFERINDIINMNPRLSASRIHKVKSPYPEITLANGSRISGFAIGESDVDTGGLATRGKDANLIVGDEIDYVGLEAYRNATKPIQMTFENVAIMMSSTPSGKREIFYNMCKQNPSYRETYVPSTKLPHWEKIKDQVLMDVETEEEVTREILALFDESGDGVFKKDHINRAVKEYSLGPHFIKDEPHLIFGVGVDWNKDRGTEIVILGFDRFRQLIKEVDAINIPAQKFTTIAGVEAIFQVNREWRPKFFYVDAGYGHTAIELIRKVALERQKLEPELTNILQGLKSWEFKESIEIRDPMTKELKQKPKKVYMIDNAIAKFERGQIHISKDDTLLKRQLEGYIIEKRQANGMPVYGVLDHKVGDHRLDAFALALVGFRQEFPDWGDVSGVTTVIATRDGHPLFNILDANPSLGSRDMATDFNKKSYFGNYNVATDRPGVENDTEEAYNTIYKRKQIQKRFNEKLFNAQTRRRVGQVVRRQGGRGNI